MSKLKTVFLVSLVSALILGWSFSVQGSQGTSLDQRLEALAVLFSQVQTIEGRFIQRNFYDYMNEPLVSTGEFNYLRPDYLSWDYLTPAWSRLEIKEGLIHGWTGIPEEPLPQPDNLVGATRVVLNQILAWMNFDLPQIRAGNRLEIISDRPLILKVVPLAGKRFVESIVVQFSDDERLIKTLTIEEKDGRAELVFERVIINGVPIKDLP